ncbi:MAG TPA: hypothetical protein VKQ36_10725, partial [Ktedonobacterales bacterium]|nr:hypothetical protein [Ktedonobacterales bacterium]
MAEQEDHPTWEGQLAAPMRAPDDAQPQQHWENHLPHDDAGYLLMDEQWHIIAANDHSALVTDDDVTRLVGRHAREALGAEALGSLQAYGTAIFTLENVEYTLTLTEFVLPDGLLRLARVQETQTTLERMLSTLVHEVRNPLTAMRALAQGLE